MKLWGERRGGKRDWEREGWVSICQCRAHQGVGWGLEDGWGLCGALPSQRSMEQGNGGVAKKKREGSERCLSHPSVQPNVCIQLDWPQGTVLQSAASVLAAGPGSANSISFVMYKTYIYSPAWFCLTINTPQRYINPIRSWSAAIKTWCYQGTPRSLVPKGIWCSWGVGKKEASDQNKRVSGLRSELWMKHDTSLKLPGCGLRQAQAGH